jgi:hypothetical protein
VGVCRSIDWIVQCVCMDVVMLVGALVGVVLELLWVFVVVLTG